MVMILENTAGENNRLAKLTNAQAAHIRKCHKNGVPVVSLAALFSVSNSVITKICKNATYTDAK